MYIKTEDFNYFESLYKSLDEEKKKKFLAMLMKTVSKKIGSTDIGKIQVVGDEVFDSRGIEQGEFITRTSIKKAYKSAKG